MYPFMCRSPRHAEVDWDVSTEVDTKSLEHALTGGTPIFHRQSPRKPHPGSTSIPGTKLKIFGTLIPTALALAQDFWCHFP